MTPPGRQGTGYIYTVSALNAETRDLLESTLGSVWVQGEISNLATPRSGHLYFTLKDTSSQVRCALFKGNRAGLAVTPADGLQVIVHGRVSLYAPRGDYQLIVDHMDPAGEGVLRQAFELLKRKLEAEGLFEPRHKRPLPALPLRIGVISSPTGAALRDILSVLERRFPAVPVLVYPIRVQGEAAAADIVAALRTADERRDCDVLILARGGGSLEDLQPFNEEAVARAIYACTLPVVSGVGHQVDFTIADFVADVRAETPSAAAAAVVPDQREWREQLDRLAGRLRYLMATRLGHEAQRLNWLSRRLRHPRQALQETQQRADTLAMRLDNAMSRQLAARSQRLERLEHRLGSTSPASRVALARQDQIRLTQRLHQAWQRGAERRLARLTLAERSLAGLDPDGVLRRGYAIVSRISDGRLVTRVAMAPAGTALKARVADGEFHCAVTPVPAENGED
ncbi:MAG: exodeoxyribonuclease VII large subunit [Gammaproteobacteria bacterium]|nr:exodeoxyribonuclease VII large subunit [Gammaproteobacteria bacterium]